jgi:hypothetical protein
MTCRHCGAGIAVDAQRCSACGTPVAAGGIDLTKQAPVAPPSVNLTKPEASHGEIAELRAAAPRAEPMTPPAAGFSQRDSPPDRSRRGWAFGLGAAVVLVAVAAVAGLLLKGNSDPADLATDKPTLVSSPDGSLSDATAGPGDEATAEPTGPTAEPTPAAGDADARTQLDNQVSTDANRADELEQQGDWVPQLASSAPGETPTAFLARYEALSSRYPDVILIWSGDWQGSFGPSSSSSWVVVNADVRESTTAPVLQWCSEEGWPPGECWAKRLDTAPDDPSANTDHYPADERNN